MRSARGPLAGAGRDEALAAAGRWDELGCDWVCAESARGMSEAAKRRRETRRWGSMRGSVAARKRWVSAPTRGSMDRRRNLRRARESWRKEAD